MHRDVLSRWRFGLGHHDSVVQIVFRSPIDSGLSLSPRIDLNVVGRLTRVNLLLQSRLVLI